MLSNDLKPYWPDIVRVGPSTSTNQYVREVSLDHLVNVYIKNYDSDANIIKKLSHEINKLNPEINHNNTNDIRLAGKLHAPPSFELTTSSSLRRSIS